MVIIDALYINQGGGKVLLELMIDALVKTGKAKTCFFLLDKRVEEEYCDKMGKENVFFFNASEQERRCFYRDYLSKEVKSIFCFANVPPPIKVKKEINVFIFFQNTLILNSRETGYGIKTIFFFY